jgi:hypothetical protein
LTPVSAFKSSNLGDDPSNNASLCGRLEDLQQQTMGCVFDDTLRSFPDSTATRLNLWTLFILPAVRRVSALDKPAANPNRSAV